MEIFGFKSPICLYNSELITSNKKIHKIYFIWFIWKKIFDPLSALSAFSIAYFIKCPLFRYVPIFWTVALSNECLKHFLLNFFFLSINLYHDYGDVKRDAGAYLSCKLSHGWKSFAAFGNMNRTKRVHKSANKLLTKDKRREKESWEGSDAYVKFSIEFSKFKRASSHNIFW